MKEELQPAGNVDVERLRRKGWMTSWRGEETPGFLWPCWNEGKVAVEGGSQPPSGVIQDKDGRIALAIP